jgi:hypothetical protein
MGLKDAKPSVIGMSDSEFREWEKTHDTDSWKKTKSYSMPKPYHKKMDGYDERNLQKEVNDLLKSLGVWWLRVEGSGKVVSTPMGKRMIPSSMTGAPDNLLLMHGEFFAAELKVPGGKLSTLQKIHLDKIREQGGNAAVVVSGIDGMRRFLCKQTPLGYIEKIPVY